MKMVDKAMAKAVIDTLENLAFMEVGPAPETSWEMTGQSIIAALLCHEPLQGEIRGIFPRGLITEIAVTVFGLQDEACSEATMQDVSAEILNTIAGRFLSELLPEQQTFRIGLPEIADRPEIEENEDWQEWFFQAGGCTFSLSLLNLTPDVFSTGKHSVADCCHPVE